MSLVSEVLQAFLDLDSETLQELLVSGAGGGLGDLRCLVFQELFSRFPGGFQALLDFGSRRSHEQLALDVDGQEEPLDLHGYRECGSGHSHLLDAQLAHKNGSWSLTLGSTQAFGYPWGLCTLQDFGYVQAQGIHRNHVYLQAP